MTTPRRINADVFRRARREGAPLHLAAYVARPAALDLTWLDHYQSDETWADFDINGRKFRASYVDPRATEGECVSCAELVDAYQRRDEGIAWMSPDQYERTEHRALTVTLLDEDDAPTGHESSLYGVCGRTDTYVDRLADERYLADTVADLAAEALASERNDAEIARNAEEIRAARRDAEREARLDDLTGLAGRYADGQLTETHLRDEMRAVLGKNYRAEPHALTFHSTITGEEGPVTMTVNPEITPRGWSPQG